MIVTLILNLLFFVVGSIGAFELASYEEIELLMDKYMKRTLNTEEERKFHDIVDLLAMPNYLLRNSLEEYAASRTTLSCVLCRAFLSATNSQIQEGISDTEMQEIFKDLCIRLNIQNQNVCEGMIKSNAPIILYIMRNNPNALPETFCGLVFQSTDAASCPLNDYRFDWQVALPVQIHQPQITNNGGSRLRILFLTDVHIDPKYQPFGVANCNEPTCCRFGQVNSNIDNYKMINEDSFLEYTLNVVNGRAYLNTSLHNSINLFKREKRRATNSNKNNAPAGYWGDYRSCDTPIWAFDDIINRVAETNENIDAIYYLGDTIDHGVWATSEELIIDSKAYFFNKLKSAFSGVPLFLAVGNHESQPTNQFAPMSISEPALSTDWLYETIINQMDDHMSEEAKSTFRQGGYYTMLLKPGLRIVVINSNIAYKYNWWINYDPNEAKVHLEWLVETLYNAEMNDEVVHILSHIPPGVSDLMYTWSREYNKIVNRFSATIKSEFNGHTHSDEFKLFYNSNGVATNVAWNGGAATAYSHYNVNYKMINVNPNTFDIEEMETYIYNLTEANTNPSGRPHWFLEYDFRSTYNLETMTPPDLDNLVTRMATTDKHLLHKYSAFFGKLSDTRYEWGCGEECEIERLCKVVTTELYNNAKCEQLSALYR